MKEVKLFKLPKYENKSKYEDLIKNSVEFNNNSTKNVEIKKETQKLRQKSLSDKNCNTEETKNQIQGFYINSAGYGMIPKLVMQDRNLSVTSKAIYAYFCSYTGAGNTCFPSYKKICYDLNVARNTFVKYLKPLVKANYIKIEHSKNTSSGKFSNNIYVLNDVVAQVDAQNVVTPSIKIESNCLENLEKMGGFTDAQNTVHGNLYSKINNIKINNNNYLSKKESKKKKQLEQDKISPKKEKNNSNSISKKQTKAKKAQPKPISFDEIIDAYTKNEDLRKELKEHLKTRKQKKAALNNRAIELSLKKLDKLADSDEEKLLIVQNSIMNGWVGFFPLKQDEKKQLRDKSSYDLDEYMKTMDTFGTEPKGEPKRFPFELGNWL